ncbi:MAG: hypothetical protein GF383_16835 [Candidatus Lokiarchaeota archaeon]|nr:hypothetical protein [Candidatus Lokiarchaeota archaeon]
MGIRKNVLNIMFIINLLLFPIAICQPIVLYIMNFIWVVLIGMMLYVKKNIIICDVCRRVKDVNNFYPIEHFYHNVSHSICNVCSGSMLDIMTLGDREQELQKRMLKSLQDLQLGELLISDKIITEEQLRECLQLRKERVYNKKIGNILMEQGYINQKQLVHYLKIQEEERNRL